MMNHSKALPGLVMLSLLFLMAFFRILPTAFTALKPAVSTSETAKQKVLGKHLFSLQWISWKNFGTVNVTDDGGTLRLQGEQRSIENDDYVTIDGVVTDITEKTFKFTGAIVMKISFLNTGKPCKRTGTYTFAIRGNRKYWRMQEIDNPCDNEGTVDYIDIYLR
jgi:hypothetical protein